MTSKAWQNLFRETADARRAQSSFEMLPLAAVKGMKVEDAKMLAAVLGGSECIPQWLVAHPEWLEIFDSNALQRTRRLAGLQRELNQLLKRQKDVDALAVIRRFKQREMIRIATRDLARLADVSEITAELSHVADVSLGAMLNICHERLRTKFGSPWHIGGDGIWCETPFSLIGLGKLGGHELNYSSDVDVMLVYEDEGHVFKDRPKGRGASSNLSSHEYFNRLVENFIAEVGGATDDGMLYRIDFRLRPEGESGPLSRSVESYENYYAQWGELWERLMLIKARPIAGDAELGAEFTETIHPFRFPRSLSESALSEIGHLKRLIEEQVVREGELNRDVKLGRGGIREVEFIVQALQLLHGGRQPFLQGSQTLPMLKRLADYDLLPESETGVLSAAYIFLREVEHRLQMENNLQTHTIPKDRFSRDRLAHLMNSTSAAEFGRKTADHMRRVRKVFDRLKKNKTADVVRVLPEEVTGHEEEWEAVLTAHGFRDVSQAMAHLREFIEGPEHTHVAAHTSRVAMDLVRTFLTKCPQSQRGKTVFPRKALSDPDRVLTRIDSFVSAYGSRSMLYEAWFANRPQFELLLLVFDRSEFLAETAIQSPDLIDEIELTGQMNRRKSVGQIHLELSYGRNDPDQSLWIRKYFRAEQMRIGLRDILELNDFEATCDELSALADACLQYALDVVMRRHRMKNPPFSIIGLGKLGGKEINFGSDLDIIFVAASKTRQLEQLANLATELIKLLSERTVDGITFQTDARLRPEGRDGLLVNDLAAHENYYRTRGELWELQTLSRARHITGDQKTGSAFEVFASKISDFKRPSLPLSAYSDDWKNQICEMRQITESERTPVGLEEFAIKTGPGGLMDVEFISQVICLAEGWHEPNTLRVLERASQSKLIAKKQLTKLVGSYRELRQLEHILRRWSYEGEVLLPDDEDALYRVSVRYGIPGAEKLLTEVTDWRKNVREVFDKFFGK